MQERRELPVSSMPYPAPAVLVTCQGKSGRPNMITLAWMSKVCMTPPVVAVAVHKARHSHGLIAEGGDFVVNVPTSEMAERVNAAGTISGRDVDKFETLGLTAELSSKVRSPSIAECPACIECRLINTVNVGTHDLFLGEVVAVRVHERLVGSQNRIDYARMDPLLYLAPGYWAVDGKRGQLYEYVKK